MTATGSLPEARACCRRIIIFPSAVHYLFPHRPQWSGKAEIGKTVVSSQMIDRISAEAWPTALRDARRFQMVCRRLCTTAPSAFVAKKARAHLFSVLMARFGRRIRMGSSRHCCRRKSPRAWAAIPGEIYQRTRARVWQIRFRTR